MNWKNKVNPYVILGIFLTILIMVNFIIIKNLLNQSHQDATIVNITGKQRMRSQQLKSAFLLRQIKPSTDLHQEAEEIFKAWKNTHQILISDEIEGTTYTLTPTIKEQLQQLTFHLELAEGYMNADPVMTTAVIDGLVHNQDSYLVAMNEVVNNIELEATQKLDKMTMSVLYLAIASVIIIIAVCRYYVYPIIRKLKLHHEVLESKNEQLEHFAYIASHDLKEPLRTITGFSEILREDYEDQLDKEAIQYFDFIQKATTRMKGLIDGLLQYSRIGKFSTLAPLDLSEVTTAILEDIDLTVKEKQADISVEKLPTVLGMETEIRQVFQNLILNAIKFSRKNITPAIAIRAKDTPSHWQFCIADNGIGIEPDKRDKIFSFFTKLHHSSEYEGYGIGLAFCQKIVELHGGKIWVESEIGKGSEFYFTITK